MPFEHEHLAFVEGDIYSEASLSALSKQDFGVVVNVIGADPLKPSTLFTDTTKAIIALQSKKSFERYFAITGTAQMEKTRFGKLSAAILKRTPVRHGVKDHQDAYEPVTRSNLSWTLVGCPYIRDGEEQGRYKTARVFPGGFKTVHPPDVASEIVKQMGEENEDEIIGVWY